MKKTCKCHSVEMLPSSNGRHFSLSCTFVTVLLICIISTQASWITMHPKIQRSRRQCDKYQSLENLPCTTENQISSGRDFKSYRECLNINGTLEVVKKSCPCGHYFDRAEKKCIKASGGGEVVYIDYCGKCKDHFVGTLVHPTQAQFYYVCNKCFVIVMKCPRLQIYDPEIGQCVNVTKPCSMTIHDESNGAIDPPSCNSSGRFSVPYHPDYFIMCTEDGDKFYRSIFKCRFGTQYDPDKQSCSEIYQGPTTTQRTLGWYLENDPYPPCIKPGKFRSPKNCSMYYVCSAKTRGTFYQLRFCCPLGNEFCLETLQCRPSEFVNCNIQSNCTADGNTCIMTENFMNATEIYRPTKNNIDDIFVIEDKILEQSDTETISTESESSTDKIPTSTEFYRLVKNNTGKILEIEGGILDESGSEVSSTESGNFGNITFSHLEDVIDLNDTILEELGIEMPSTERTNISTGTYNSTEYTTKIITVVDGKISEESDTEKASTESGNLIDKISTATDQVTSEYYTQIEKNTGQSSDKIPVSTNVEFKDKNLETSSTASGNFGDVEDIIDLNDTILEELGIEMLSTEKTNMSDLSTGTFSYTSTEYKIKIITVVDGKISEESDTEKASTENGNLSDKTSTATDQVTTEHYAQIENNTSDISVKDSNLEVTTTGSGNFGNKIFGHLDVIDLNDTILEELGIEMPSTEKTNLSDKILNSKDDLNSDAYSSTEYMTKIITVVDGKILEESNTKKPSQESRIISDKISSSLVEATETTPTAPLDSTTEITSSQIVDSLTETRVTRMYVSKNQTQPLNDTKEVVTSLSPVTTFIDGKLHKLTTYAYDKVSTDRSQTDPDCVTFDYSTLDLPKCTSQGIYSLNGSCSKYYHCNLNENGKFEIELFECPKCLRFNEEKGFCDLPANVPRCLPEYLKKHRETCKAEGSFPINGECQKYKKCFINNKNELDLEILSCAEGMNFNPLTKECDNLYKCSESRPHPKCVAAGFFPDEERCNEFYECIESTSLKDDDKVQFSFARFICPSGMVFNDKNGFCDLIKNVPWCDKINL